MSVLFEVEDIHKTFGRVAALKGVSLKLKEGSVHAVLGENGAGKSTLMKIIAGVYQPTKGNVKLRGKKVVWQNPQQARDGGVSTIFQEFTLLDNLSVAENLFLGREPTRYCGLLDMKKMHEQSRGSFQKLQLDIDPGVITHSLRIAEQQMVEITKGLMSDADVFVFDEPTAALGEMEVERLFAVIRELQGGGKGILYISHRLPEIFSLCDEATVLKDGAYVGSFRISDTSSDELVAAMVGRELDQLYPEYGKKQLDEQDIRLECREITSRRLKGPINLKVYGNEIVGLAGLEGQGQIELTRTLFEGRPITNGVVRFLGNDCTHTNPEESTRSGMGLIPEDRKTEGLFLDLGVNKNIEAGLISGQSPWSRFNISPSKIMKHVDSLGIRMENLQAPIVNLSGGNQQKALLARWLIRGVKLLICEEPTRGIDIGAKGEIYALLRALADSGTPILVVSRELPELIGLCDRILVMRDHQIVGELAGTDATEEKIMQIAMSRVH